jgi:hypothetical protein
MASQQEISTELSPEIFLSLSPEKANILKSAQPSLFALLENPEFHQHPEEESFGPRCGLVFETLARKEIKSPHSPLKPLQRLEKLMITSMSSDIGFLIPPGLSFRRPDILVMEYDEVSKVVTITRVGEIKLGLWATSPDQLKRIWQQHDELINDITNYLGKLHQFRDSRELESLFKLPVQKIRLLTEEEGLELFYVIPRDATIPPSMKDWKIHHSNFSQQEIEEITQALLKAAVSKA